MTECAQKARTDFEAALENNLNTAEALAAIFGLVSAGNTAMDRGEFCAGDRERALETLAQWDHIFAVAEDNDFAKLSAHGLAVNPVAGALPASVAEGAESSGNGAPRLISDDEIEKRIAHRTSARARGNYAESDRIREELLRAGVMLEDTKAGARWRRL